MFSPVCGNRISENHKFCYNCGSATPVVAGNGLQQEILHQQSSTNVDKLQNTGECSTPTFKKFQAAKEGKGI